MPPRPPRTWSELTRLHERLNELLEQAMASGGEELSGGAQAGAWRPTLDLVETADAYVLYVELPGLDRDEIELRVDGRWLEFSGCRETVDGERGFLRLERHYGPFRRRIGLPEAVASDAVEARLRDGLLEVTVAKSSGAEDVVIGGE